MKRWLVICLVFMQTGYCADHVDHLMTVIGSDKVDATIAELTSTIVQTRIRSLDARIDDLNLAACSIHYLRLCKKIPEGQKHANTEVLRWLVNSSDRLRGLIDLIHAEDDWPKAFEIVNELYRYDPKERDKYYNLILAIAVVWDQPRPLPHNYMGRERLAYKPDLPKRYDFFKKVYGTVRGRLPFNRLSPSDLTYVVDTPVPVSELEWGLKYVKCSINLWKKTFHHVKYDRNRFARSQFSWSGGPYSLLNIRKKGGICVDQAYYSNMCARANGIPSMLFIGKGRRGGHGWVGIMVSAGAWKLDVARYANDNYEVGMARNPQTNKMMNDHELQYATDPMFRSASYQKAAARNNVAGIFFEQKRYGIALRLADEADALAGRNDASWKLMLKIYENTGREDEAIKLLHRKASDFSRYPDIVVELGQKQIALLRKLGKTREADRRQEDLQRKMRKRDDLLAEIASRRAEELIAVGKNKEAREAMEDFLKRNAREGFKVISVVEDYIEMTKRVGETKGAARFMKLFYSRTPKANRGWVTEFLIQAYENAGDKRSAQKLREATRRDRKKPAMEVD